jgi:hypothetical protein
MIRKVAILLLLIGVIASLLVSTGLFDFPKESPFTHLEPTKEELDASLRTDWFGVYLKDKKIGYFRTSRERTAEGIRESALMHMKLVSQKHKDEMIVSQSNLFEEKPPYALLKTTYKEQAGATASELILTRTGAGKFDAVQKVGLTVRKKSEVDLDFNLAESLLAAELWVRRGPNKDKPIFIGDVNAKEQKIDSTRHTLLATKSSLVNGVEVKFYEIESTSAPLNVTWMSRYDDQGKMLSGKMEIFDVRAETEEQAKNTEYSQDLFVLGTVKVETPLGNLRQILELVLEVDGPAKVFGDGPRQTIVTENGKPLLRLGKRYGKTTPATADERAQNLKETNAYFLSNPKVKALAASAAGDATTDEAKVKNIARFVHDFIDPRLGYTFPTIQNLIERRQGDCKSYALLFATLARANGVPAREVAGLVYCGDDAQAFGGHAWNEVILNGVWVPIDASLNETEINATHLSFGAETTGLSNLLQTLGNLKLKVIEFKKD